MMYTQNNPVNYYEDKLGKASKILSEVKNRSRIISLTRIFVFLVTIIGIYISVANGFETLAIISSTGFLLFIYLVRVHSVLEKRKKWHETIITINNKELKLIKGNTDGIDTGNEFINASHPYSSDLDIFGSRSLFQLINRTSTATGRSLLAHRLNNPINDISKLNIRQAAISELSTKPDWRQNFEATGNIFSEENIAQNELINWTKTTGKKFDTLFYRIMLIANPLLGIAIITLINLQILTTGTFLLFLILPLLLVGTKMGVINKIHTRVSKKSDLLIKYSRLFGLITDEEFSSELLVEAKESINGNHSAHKAIDNLSGIVKQMDYRLNFLVGIVLNIFFLWDIKQSIKIERWKKNNTAYMEDWFNKLSVIDEIQSFAGFAFNFPESTLPSFTQGDFTIEATNVKHPTINQASCIGNDISFKGWKQFQIITGANMAGKSTYLRTVGINMVLAMTGSLVLANSFSITPVGIFTGIKTSDSLQDGESYFFAELKRLKALIDNLKEGQKLFVILDEVLRGTNSADKQKGSMALITQLITMSATGMIATHDLALGSLINEFPNNITNKRFEVEMDDNELIFDYKLKTGISQNLNATFLMKKMGITV